MHGANNVSLFNQLHIRLSSVFTAPLFEKAGNDFNCECVHVVFESVVKTCSGSSLLRRHLLGLRSHSFIVLQSVLAVGSRNRSVSDIRNTAAGLTSRLCKLQPEPGL